MESRRVLLLKLISLAEDNIRRHDGSINEAKQALNGASRVLDSMPEEEPNRLRAMKIYKAISNEEPKRGMKVSILA